MSVLWQDTRLALRNLRRIPGFTLLVLLTLGVGIGATTAMFSAVNEVLLRPLSFAEPERLVMLWDKNELRGWEQVEASPANALDWRQRVTSFGAPPLHGRTFTFEETWADAGPLVVLGHALWTRYFGADPSIVGTTIMLSTAPPSRSSGCWARTLATRSMMPGCGRRSAGSRGCATPYGFARRM